MHSRLNRKILKAIALSFTILLAACVPPKNSNVKIINGVVHKVNMADGNGYRIGLGIRFAFQQSDLGAEGGDDDITCSGFRYGNKTIVTAAHCLDAQVPGWKNRINDVFIHFMTGTGSVFTPEKVANINVHKTYFPGCMKELTCVDLAVVTLTDGVLSSQWLDTTDPADFDLRGGFHPTERPILVAFGCTAETWYGRCANESGFRDNSFTTALDLKEAVGINLPIKVPESRSYYYRVRGENPQSKEDDKEIEITFGDSGGPLISGVNDEASAPSFQGRKALVKVGGLAIKTKEFESKLEDDGLETDKLNLVLDLGHPSVGKWLKETADFNDKVIALPSGDSLCPPLSVFNDGSLDRVPGGFDVDRLGVELPEELLSDIKSIKSRAYQHGFASCFARIFKKLEQLEALPTSKDKPFLLAKLDGGMVLQALSLQAYLEYEKTKDSSWLDMAIAYSTDSEYVMTGLDTIAGTIPGVAAAHDIIVITTGKDMFGRPISEEERLLTTAMFFAPGAAKYAGKGAIKSVKYLDKVASASGRYKGAKGRLGTASRAVAETITPRLATVKTIFDDTVKAGLKTAEQIKKFGKEIEIMGPVCKLLTFQDLSPKRKFDFFNFLIPTAYAAPSLDELSKCSSLVAMLKKANIPVGGDNVKEYQRTVNAIISGTKEALENAKFVKFLADLDSRISPEGFVHIIAGNFKYSVIKDASGVSKTIPSFDGGLHYLPGYDEVKKTLAFDELDVRTLESGYQLVKSNGVSTRYIPSGMASKKTNTGAGSAAYFSVLKTVPSLQDLKDADKLDFIIELVRSPAKFSKHRDELIASREIIKGSDKDKELLGVMQHVQMCVNPKKADDAKGILCDQIGKSFFPSSWNHEKISKAAMQLLDAPESQIVLRKSIAPMRDRILGKIDGIWCEMFLNNGKVDTFYPTQVQDDELMINLFNVLTRKE